MRLYASSDWHGNKEQAVRALQAAGLVDAEENWVAKDTTLVICGDMIDRGPDSKGTVEFAKKIQEQAINHGSLVETLLGNHEKMLLDGENDDGWYVCWLRNGGFSALQSYAKDVPIIKDYYDRANVKIVMDVHGDFFKSLKPFVVINGILFVHAGVHPNGDISDLHKKSDMDSTLYHLWIRDQFYMYPSEKFLNRYGVKKIFFGHTPTDYIKRNMNQAYPQEKMQPMSLLNDKIVGIDTGSYYENGCTTVVQIFDDLSWSIAGTS